MGDRSVEKTPAGYEGWSVDKRADWVLAQLRRLPGSRVERKGAVWCRLDYTSSLVGLIQQWMPKLTRAQAVRVNRDLKDRGDRESVQRTNVRSEHFVRLEADAAEPGTDGQLVTADELSRAGHMLLALAEKTGDLEARLAAAQEE